MVQTTSKNTKREVYQTLSNSLVKTVFQGDFVLDHIEEYKKKLFHFADSADTLAIYQNNYSNEHSDPYFIAAIGVESEIKLNSHISAWDLLKEFTDEHKGQWIAGAMAYDLKNDLEEISSSNEDSIGLPEMHFFIPSILISIQGNKVKIKSGKHTSQEIHNSILNQEILSDTKHIELKEVKKKPEKEQYIQKVETLLNEIKQGNIYEINYCRELLSNSEINPVATALALAENSPAPFSVFYKTNDKYIICASPERFLLKNKSVLISQPIKGTTKRGENSIRDEELKLALYNDPKERAENVMIVDLVRNDLSRSAKRGSVNVNELFEIYSFPHVHQMISTIQSELNENMHFVDAMKHCFPMGSMTGAPKLRAMKLIEEHEFFKRGMFSGSLGLITPEQDFDFNVVIRSILYDVASKRVSIRTGGAITAMCKAEKEWEECEVKAAALLNALKS